MNAAVIVAAGKGLRMGADVPKQYLPLCGRPVLWHTLQAFEACAAIDRIAVCVPEKDMGFCRSEILDSLKPPVKSFLVAGGRERQESVYNGILALDRPACRDGIVVIHDGVRPFVRDTDIRRCIRTAAMTGACILGIPATDTLKQVDRRGLVEKTLSRHSVWLAQTPQAFRYALIRSAHETARQKGVLGTDDAQLVEIGGGSVRVIRGDRGNLKITTPEDLVLARAMCAAGDGSDAA